MPTTFRIYADDAEEELFLRTIGCCRWGLQSLPGSEDP
ncbi:helix-turn-helix domain-containing protein [Bradyrhizobium sp. 31Argb]